MKTEAREPRRLETGDWVHVRGDDPSIRGVAKIIDGDFAAEDDALMSCEIEVGARRVWISPADLTRITPEEEARLCEVALARGLVPGEKRARLDEALRELRASERAFIRTPGLVDLLWATSTLADPTHGSGAVTAFLTEEALDALSPPPPPPPPASPERPRPSAAISGPLAAVLVPLDRAALVGLAARLRVDLGPDPTTLDALAVQRRIVAAGVTAGEAVAALDPRHGPGWVLREALALLNRGALAALAGAFGVKKEDDKSLQEGILELPPAAPLRHALAVMSREQLHLLCERLHMERMPAIVEASDVRARIENVAGLPPAAAPGDPV